ERVVDVLGVPSVCANRQGRPLRRRVGAIVGLEAETHNLTIQVPLPYAREIPWRSLNRHAIAPVRRLVLTTVTSARTIEADVCVVGAGIVGLAHALEARKRGLRVAVLERDARAVGASVRNFGHGIVCAMDDGEAFEFALAARERWLELGARAG